ncbi:hypothetical protein [Streptomyces cucumeris]|uniref:hypothetical protein n=1 Tax=Streptomyces cucumeris TaxID=2962890 RepID=UPI003D720798
MGAAVRLPVAVRIGLLAAALPAAFRYPLQDSATATQDESILYDPGPTLRCYSVSVETTRGNYGNDTTDCPEVDNEARRNPDGCKWFGYVSPAGRPECPTWRFINDGWPEKDLRRYPGYDHQAQGPSGSPLKLVMQNNARNITDHRGLREVAFSYEYIGSSLKRNTRGEPYDFADGHLKVSYDAFAKQSGDLSCKEEKRAVLTTDLIYYAPGGGKNVISVVHYDPGHFAAPNEDGVLWWNQCAGSRTDDGRTLPGCRVTVLGQQVEPDSPTRVNVDFTGLAERYRAYLSKDPAGPVIPEGSAIDAIQMVNSVRGADLETRVSHADVTIDPSDKL